MLQGIAQTATQLTQVATGKVGAPASQPGSSFASVIRREQPVPAAPAAGGPLGASPASAAPATDGPGLAQRSMTRMVDGQRKLERSMQRALRGDDFSPQQLLALQLQVQKFSIEVEAVSRVVDRVTGAVKQTMQTQI